MILAIDTSTRHVSLALHDGRQVLAETTWRSPGHHSVDLAPRVAAMLSEAGIGGVAGLTGVAVALGPGAFTGLRAGVALAKGLALAGPVPLVGVPTLDVLAAAQARPVSAAARLVAILSAGRGRLFAAFYRWPGGKAAVRNPDAAARERWTCVEPPRILAWDGLLASATGDPLFFCGEIDAAGAAALKKLGRRARLVPGAHSLRRAGFLAQLALERLERGESDNPATLVPLYLHEPGSGSHAAEPESEPPEPAESG